MTTGCRTAHKDAPKEFVGLFYQIMGQARYSLNQYTMYHSVLGKKVRLDNWLYSVVIFFFTPKE